MKYPKEIKPKLSDWLLSKLNIAKASKYKGQLLNELQTFQDKLKSDIQNKIESKNHLVPILNGLKGDEFEANNDSLAIKMLFRYNNQDVAVEELSAYYDFKLHAGKINILIHGLMGDEYMWKKENPTQKNKIGDWLENNSLANNLYLRYNTGLHISENGRALSDLLEKFTTQYSDEIKQINLIGHSMGGLLIRSAGYYADIQRQNWIDKLKAVFLIGVPNEGSYLAQIGFFVNHVFRKIDISHDDYVARLMDVRSNGIKDLSFAYLTDEDWLHKDSEDMDKHPVTNVRPILKVKYYLIGGVIGKKSDIVHKYFGDGLVGSTSALTNQFASSDSTSIENIIFEKENHMSLLESEQVAEYIVGKLAAH